MTCKKGKAGLGSGRGYWIPLCVALGMACMPANSCLAQKAVFSVTPDADAFLRSLAAASNYGGGGALSVSGSAAVNGSNEQNGLFDTLIRFSTTDLVTSLDSTFGTQGWIITSVRLLLNEMAVPDNDIFNRGVGGFEVRWIASIDWVEGTGKPIMPTSDGVAWQDLPGILNSNLDVSLGVFTNTGIDGPVPFNLPLTNGFIEDIRSAGEVAFYLTAATPQIGFTFNSRQFGNTNARPTLEITAVPDPKPRIDTIALLGTSVSVTFETTSNWTYTLQGLDSLSGSFAGTWSNLLVVPPQSLPGHVSYQEEITNRQRFYRLSLSPEQ